MHFAAIITQKSKRKFYGMEFRGGLHAKTFYYRHNPLFNLKHTVCQVNTVGHSVDYLLLKFGFK